MPVKEDYTTIQIRIDTKERDDIQATAAKYATKLGLPKKLSLRELLHVMHEDFKKAQKF